LTQSFIVSSFLLNDSKPTTYTSNRMAVKLALLLMCVIYF